MLNYLFICFLGLQGGQQPIEERFRVDFVTLDIVVRNKKGDLVTDLKLSDFEVIENKKKVNVTFFDTLDYQDPGLTVNTEVDQKVLTKPTEEEVEAKQQIIIAMDFESVPRTELANSFGQLEDFFNDLPNDGRYRINLYSLSRGSLTNGFTIDTDEALSALLNWRDKFLKIRLRQNRFDTDDFSRGRVKEGRSRKATTRSRKGFDTIYKNINDLADLEQALVDCEGYPEAQDSYGGPCHCMADSVEVFLQEQTLRTERIVGQLEILANKFEDNNGLKTMLLMSPGFGLRQMSAVDSLLRHYQSKVRKCEATLGGVQTGYINPDIDFRRIAHACIRNRVIFHIFDIYNANMGLKRRVSVVRAQAPRVVTSAFQTFSHEIADGSRSLAEESGGSFIQKDKVETNMIDVLQENRFFYVLGYQSPEGKPGKYRKIKVKLKNKRKGLKLSYRRGYYGS